MKQLYSAFEGMRKYVDPSWHSPVGLLPFALIAPRALAYRCGYGVEWSALHVFGAVNR